MADKSKTDLQVLGSRLKTVDFLLLELLKRRMDLALDVVDCKMRDAEAGISKDAKIFRPKIEAERLIEIARHAKKININPGFAQAMLYAAIGESCKVQMVRFQDANGKTRKPRTDKQLQASFKRNLLRLTKLVAPVYDTTYDRPYHATGAYLEFEKAFLKNEIARLPDHAVMLDLGCATGSLSCRMAGDFERVVGYDVSPHMLDVARKKAADQGLTNVNFTQGDLEEGIPEPDDSVSLAVMNLGTASDMRNIKGVIGEIRRVLKPGGRFVLSFYNRDALLYRWDFIPWEVGLAAVADINRDYVNVHIGGEVLPVYAHAYSPAEVRAMLSAYEGFGMGDMATYPTMSPILPADLFEGQNDVLSAIMAIDEHLSQGEAGAYIVVSGWKSPRA